MSAADEILALLESMRPRTDELLSFVPGVSPMWQAPTHLRPVADLFARVERGEQVFGCVSVPPRHGKTELILHALAWLMLRRPTWELAYTSYAGDFARSKSARAQRLAADAGVALAKPKQKAIEWFTREGGVLRATGVQGQLTGHGARLLIVDDPHKDRAEAESPTMRQAVHDWFTSTAATRVEPGGSIIVVHTRWHPDDLIGRLAQDDRTNWEIVNLPAVNEDETESLWPARWAVAELLRKKAIIGDYDWASLFLGLPRPRGGALFREPARFELPDISGALIFLACDPAATAKTRADWSVIGAVAAKGSSVEDLRMDLLEVQRMQVEIPELCSQLHAQAIRWGAPIAVEAVAGFKAVPQTLRALDPRLDIIEVNPQGDKFTRALPVAAAWNRGRVRVPMHAPWLVDFLAEVKRFTGLGDVHDDQVDMLSTAWHGLLESMGAVERYAPNASEMPFG